MKYSVRLVTTRPVVAATAVISALLLFVGIASFGLAAEDDTSSGPDLQFYVAPFKAVKGEKIRLDWESDGAEYCTASGAWSGKKEPTGSVRVAVKKTGVYELECFDDEGVATKKISRKVTVVASKKKLKRKKLKSPVPEITGHSHARTGEEITLAWSSSKGTVACWASGPQDWEGLKAPQGSDYYSAEPGKEYALVCWNENGEEGNKVTYVVEKKAMKYTARDVGLSSDYLPLYPDDYTLADGSETYYIDFVRPSGGGYYFGKRILINPYTHELDQDKARLKELDALSSQVPENVYPNTKQLIDTENVSYLVNESGELPEVSPDEAHALANDAVADYLTLPREEYKDFFSISPIAIFFSLAGGAKTPMYFVLDGYMPDPEPSFVRRIVIDPYTGKDYSDQGLFDRDQSPTTDDKSSERKITPPPQGPVSNPPEQMGVLPPEQPKKEELKKKEEAKTEEKKTDEQIAPTSCPAGYLYSPTLQKCYEDTSNQQNEAKQSCSVGYSYSVTLKMCVKD